MIVTSTTGDGDPPENADKFWRKIRRKTLKPDTLLCVRYAILGEMATQAAKIIHK